MTMLTSVHKFSILGLVLFLTACQYLAPTSFDRNDRTPGKKVDDKIIENSIVKQIKTEGLHKPNHINVNVFNAIVLFTGEVDGQKTKQKLTNIANNLYQVRKAYDVTNIAAPSSYVARSSDSVITGSIKAQLFRYPETRKSKVKVVTEDGVVYLLGLVSEPEALKIVRTASSVSGVQKIVKLFEIIP